MCVSEAQGRGIRSGDKDLETGTEVVVKAMKLGSPV